MEKVLAQGEKERDRFREQLLVLLPVWPDSPAPGLSLSSCHSWPAQPGNGQLALLPSSGTVLVWKYP